MNFCPSDKESAIQRPILDLVGNRKISEPSGNSLQLSDL
jgi:hypothetical protein